MAQRVEASTSAATIRNAQQPEANVGRHLQLTIMHARVAEVGFLLSHEPDAPAPDPSRSGCANRQSTVGRAGREGTNPRDSQRRKIFRCYTANEPGRLDLATATARVGGPKRLPIRLASLAGGTGGPSIVSGLVEGDPGGRRQGGQCARCPVHEIARLTPSRLLGVPAEVRHGAGEVEDIDDDGDCTVYALESELRVVDQAAGPDHDADAAHVDVGELRAVDDEVAPGLAASSRTAANRS